MQIPPRKAFGKISQNENNVIDLEQNNHRSRTSDHDTFQDDMISDHQEHNKTNNLHKLLKIAIAFVMLGGLVSLLYNSKSKLSVQFSSSNDIDENENQQLLTGDDDYDDDYYSGKNNAPKSEEWVPSIVYDGDLSSFDPKSLNLNTKQSKLMLKADFSSNKTYLFKIHSVSKSSISMTEDEAIEQIVMLDVDEEMSIMDFGDHQRVDIGITNFAVMSEGLGMEINFDSSREFQNNDTFGNLLKSLVGKKISFEINSDHDVVSSEDDNVVLEEMGLGDLSPVSHFQSIARMTDTLPSTSVGAGDEWDIELSIDNPFIGKAQLLGFLEYEGVDCALISIDGKLDLDDIVDTNDSELLKELGNPEGFMKGLLLWDPAKKMNRWTKIEVSMSTSVTIGDVTVNVPSSVETVIYASIKN